MTTEEVNITVARKLGVKCETAYSILIDQDGTKRCQWCNTVMDYSSLEHYKQRSYSTSIEAACDVVEKMSDDYEVTINVAHRKFWCHASGPTWKQMVTGEADTAARAICLAFLKLP